MRPLIAAALCLLLFFGLSSGCCHLSVRDTVARIDDSVVELSIDDGQGRCTGFMVRGRVVTAGHCVASLQDEIWARDHHGHVFLAIPVTDDDQRDLAVLAIENPDIPDLELGGEPSPGERLVSFGYPYYQSVTGSLCFEVGYFISVAREGSLKRLLASEVSFRGESGGPVVDESGRVIGVVSGVVPTFDWLGGPSQLAHMHKNISVLVPVELLKQLLK